MNDGYDMESSMTTLKKLVKRLEDKLAKTNIPKDVEELSTEQESLVEPLMDIVSKTIDPLTDYESLDRVERNWEEAYSKSIYKDIIQYLR